MTWDFFKSKIISLSSSYRAIVGFIQYSSFYAHFCPLVYLIAQEEHKTVNF